jgi:hypothetical protein
LSHPLLQLLRFQWQRASFEMYVTGKASWFIYSKLRREPIFLAIALLSHEANPLVTISHIV